MQPTVDSIRIAGVRQNSIAEYVELYRNKGASPEQVGRVLSLAALPAKGKMLFVQETTDQAEELKARD